MSAHETSLNRAKRASHEAQFGGTDYQVAAWDALQGLPVNPTDEDIAEVETFPDPGCNCGFCAAADWKVES